MNEKRKFISLFSLFLVLVTILVIMLGLTNSHNPTSTRYIKREKDEVRAYYTSLYFDATGEGSGIALEEDADGNSVGYVTLDLKNYVDENVTKRDIEYKIATVDKYYDQNGNQITDPTKLDGNTNLYVLDLWNQPLKIENNTCKYNINVESNSGEKTSTGNYLFRYEERGASGVGKTHKAALKITRKSSFASISETSGGTEKISIVVDIIKPYKTVYIVNMYVSNRLIMFSNMNIDLFEIPFKSLQIQTANAFEYAYKEKTSGTAGTTETPVTPGTSQSFKTAKAFKVTLSWENLMLNEGLLKRTVHNNYSNLLLTSEPSNIDISKPYFSLADLKQPIEGQTYKGSLVIYVPQSSNFNLYYLPISSNYSIKVKVEIWHDDKDETTVDTYKNYTLEEFGGYELDPTTGEMTVMSSSTSEGGNANG